jgi:hypothetical protein
MFHFGDEKMGNRRRYIRRAEFFVCAVQLDLDTEGFNYIKWGAQQRCKQGDWIVDNGGDIYTIDREVFEKTYLQVGLGRYVKATPVWAEVAARSGKIKTVEGASYYGAGDYLVYNNENGTDAFCISAEKFESMYELED